MMSKEVHDISMHATEQATAAINRGASLICCQAHTLQYLIETSIALTLTMSDAIREVVEEMDEVPAMATATMQERDYGVMALVIDGALYVKHDKQGRWGLAEIQRVATIGGQIKTLLHEIKQADAKQVAK